MNPEHMASIWYGGKTPGIGLRALAALYGRFARMRRALYRRHMLASIRLSVPVVVIGNVAVGGTGKTPLALWLAQGLADAGRRPGIVCRSYGARAVEAKRVLPLDDPDEAGDEAVLMALRAPCPVWSGPKRAQAAAAMVDSHPEVDVAICDDGLQHYALARDMEIAVVDAARGFGNGRLLPAGPLREPASRLAEADEIVLHGDADVAGLPALVSRRRMRLVGDRFAPVAGTGPTIDAGALAGKRLAAVAGIGNPTRFFDHLRSLGLAFTPHAFPDHHRYSRPEIAAIEADCVLMTEKDAIKCRRFGDERLWMLPVRAEVDPALLAAVLTRIAQPRREAKPMSDQPGDF